MFNCLSENDTPLLLMMDDQCFVFNVFVFPKRY